MKSDIHWMPARITACRDLTPTVREFEITPEAGIAAAHEPGAHLQVQVLVGEPGAGRMQTRSYSLVGEPDGRAWRIAVKRLDDGRGGSLAMWRLAAGDRLLVSEPQNHFALDLDARRATCWWPAASASRRWCCMAQRLAALAQRGGVPVRMLYGARSAEELAYLPAAAGSARRCARPACRRTPAARHRLRRRDRGAAAPAASSTPAGRCRCSKRSSAPGRGRPAAGRPALRDLRQQRPAADAGLRGAHSAPRPARSRCRPTARCSKRSKPPACRRCGTAGAANAACARWTCWPSTARSTTATCS